MKLLRVVLLAAVVTAISFAQDLQPVRSPIVATEMASVAPEHQTVVRGVLRDMNTFIPPPASTGRPATATFIVTYNGFTPQAQAAFQYAVNIWASLLTSAVPIRVTANWTALPPNVLGSAGASALYRDFPNAPQAGTWYAVAVAEKLAGADLNPTTSADINANFSSAIPNWYFGTDGNTPSGQFDFVTIVLHELGHGLSFFGSMTVSSGQGSWGGGTAFPYIYDRYAENNSAQALLNTTLFPNPSVALATQLQSNNIFFNGPQAVAANGGIRPRLYAPGSWIQGSSYSHLDEATYPAGNQHSLMTPEIGTAEAIHTPGPITLGMFRDMGWTTGGGGGSTVKFEERFLSTTVPAGWRVVDNDGGGTPLAFRQQIVFQSGDTIRPQIGTSFWFGSYNGANASGRIDEWLIGPRINNIAVGDTLSFWAGAIDGQFKDSLRVWISTTDSNRTSFTNLIGYFKVDGPIRSWHEYKFPLSQFAGSNIFFAVNYYIVNGGPSGTHSDNVWIDHFTVTSVGSSSVPERRPGEIPVAMGLEQNYPNPFNPSTRIRFDLLAPEHATLKVFDMLGREVATLVDGQLTAGSYESTFNAERLSSGMYFYRLQAGTFSETKRMMLLK